MKKKVLSMITAITLATTVIPCYSFASESCQTDVSDPVVSTEEVPFDEQMSADDIANVMESYVNEDEINNNIVMEKGALSAEGMNVDLTIPQDGTQGIVMEDMDSNPIEMFLPPEVGNENAEVSEDGTVVYNPENENVAVGVQALSDGTGQDHWEAVRVLIEINNNDANKEYSFQYNLPQGYRLMKAEKWYKKYIKPQLKGKEKKMSNMFYEKGEVYVIKKDGTVVETIEPAWAYDANQNPIPTHYEIRGNELVQVVAFDENTAFPVIADPTKHPDKVVTKTISKKQVKKIRNSYSPNKRISYLCSLFSFGASFANPVIGVPWTMASLCGSYYYTKNYSLWNDAYVKMLEKGKSSVKVTMRYKWHAGHRAYYPATNSLQFSY